MLFMYIVVELAGSPGFLCRVMHFKGLLACVDSRIIPSTVLSPALPNTNVPETVQCRSS